MLKVEEILNFIRDNETSEKHRAAKTGQNYYEGKHDILGYRMFYYNADGQLVEDKYRSNIKIPHPFFTELVDQAVQYMLSGKDGFVRSDNPKLQAELDAYFNENEDFTAELSETITGSMAKGFDYMYAYKNGEDKLAFLWADSLDVVEAHGKNTSDGRDYIIYKYTENLGSGNKKKQITYVQVWDDKETWYYVQDDNGQLILDEKAEINPRPHIIYSEEGKPDRYFDGFGFIPFFRLDNNKKKTSGLKSVKALIDDYDLMASSLSNNLVDFDTPIHVVKGFHGDNLDELQTNVKTKKLVGIDEDGGLEIKTVDVPYQARKEKLELDEKSIYRFGMGLNTSGLKDTAATTSIAIKAAYSLLDLKCLKFEIKLKQFMRKILKIVLDEINTQNGTDYQMSQVYFVFDHEIMSNAQENAQIDLTEAQKRQAEINTLLGLADRLGNDLLMQLVCEQLDIEYEQIKSKLPDPDEAANSLTGAAAALEGVEPTGGGVVE